MVLITYLLGLVALGQTSTLALCCAVCAANFCEMWRCVRGDAAISGPHARRAQVPLPASQSLRALAVDACFLL